MELSTYRTTLNDKWKEEMLPFLINEFKFKVINNNFVEIETGKYLYDLASWLASETKTPYNENSFMKGQRQVIAFLGEFAFMVYYSSFNSKWSDGIESDCQLNGLTFDVKSKKNNTDLSVQFRDSWEASVALTEYTQRQNVDFYYFVRVCDIDKNAEQDYFERYPKIWLLGFINKNNYFSKGRFLKKGDIDSSNNYTVKWDCCNMRYVDLKSPNRIKELFS